MALARGINKAVDALSTSVSKMATPIDGKNRKEIQQIATIAGNNDPTIGSVLSDAFLKVGKDGVITVEEGRSSETTVEVVEGMQFDRGFLSPHFVTDVDNQVVELNSCLILIFEEKISSAKKLVPILEAVSKANKPLLIIAEDIEGEALATLVVNKMRGILNVCAVKAPGYGDRRKAMLGDIAVLTGGTAVFKDLGIDLESVQLSDLGKARKINISSEDTTMIGGGGKKEEIAGRADQIRNEISATDSEYDREKLQERLAKLAGGVAVINVGAATETEMKEKKARVEDALHATRAAVEEGIVPGGGVALLRTRPAVDKLELEGDQQIGVEIIKSALESPLRALAANAGLEGAVIVQGVIDSKGNSGFNVATEKYQDLVKAGVVDPKKVTRTALQNAGSIAGLLLTTECLITEIPEKEPPAPAGGGHDHGMM